MSGALIGAGALLWKELDSARPYLWAMLAHALVHVAGMLMEPLGGSSRWAILTLDFEILALIGAFIVFSMAHGLPAQEHAERHVEFLDGLPVTRTAVYLSKIVALAVPIVVLVVSMGAIRAVLGALVSPPESAFGFDVLAIQMVRALALCVGLGGLGLLLSWLRGLGWGVMILGIFTVSMIGYFWSPIRPYGVIEGMVQLEWADGGVVDAWGPVLTWWGLGILGAFLSLLLFQGGGGFLLNPRSWAARGLRIVAVGCGSLLFIALAALSAVGLLAQNASRFIVDAQVVQVGKFSVMYPRDREAEALVLAGELESIEAWLTTEIQSEGSSGLAIEMLGASNAHAGLFLGGKIRMSLDNEPERTLVHELAHAHHYVLRGGTNRHHNAMRFFEEGMAEYYERRYAGTLDEMALPAAIWQTDQADFALLTDDRARTAVHDPDQAYPLGRVFVGAVIDTHGEGAPACLQREIGRLSLGDTAGMGLWFEITRQCGYDLERILARYEEVLRASAADLPELPKLTGRIDRASSPPRYVVHDEHDVAEVVWCRFRDDSGDSRNLFRVRKVVDGACRISTDAIGGDTFEVQLGFDLPDKGGRVYTKWTEGKL